MISNLRFAFFGTPDIAASVLDELEKAGYLPALVVTAPDKPAGRGLTLTPPPIKEWAVKHSIPTFQPDKHSNILENVGMSEWDFMLVAAFGMILPKELLALPKHGVLNIHPSLLPRYRGASPVRSAILADEHTGVTVMQLDEKMDHGPIIAQKRLEPAEWPPHAAQFEDQLMREGARLLAQLLPHWIAGEVEAREQNHDLATYCEKIEKEDGLLDLSADPALNLRKIRAYEGWPGTYSFFERNGKQLRVQILDARVESDKFVIERVKPEGKGAMAYGDFLRSGAKPIE